MAKIKVFNSTDELRRSLFFPYFNGVLAVPRPTRNVLSAHDLNGAVAALFVAKYAYERLHISGVLDGCKEVKEDNPASIHRHQLIKNINKALSRLYPDWRRGYAEVERKGGLL